MEHLKNSILLCLIMLLLGGNYANSQVNQDKKHAKFIVLSNFPNKTTTQQVDAFILKLKNYTCQSQKIGQGKFKINIPTIFSKEWIKPCPSHIYEGQNIVFRILKD